MRVPIGVSEKDILLNSKTHLKIADVVRKIIFRYVSVPSSDGSTNIFIQRLIKDISIKPWS